MKMLIACAVAGLLLGGAEQAPKPALSDLAWIAGSWTGSSGGIDMEEHWTAPKGNSMIGMHRDAGKGRTLSFEFLRIELQGDQIVYLSMTRVESIGHPLDSHRLSAAKGPQRGLLPWWDHDILAIGADHCSPDAA